MKVHIGILGDPAKLDLYNDDFYSLIQYDTSLSLFYLIGASEYNVSKKQYTTMYNKLYNSLIQNNTQPIKTFSTIENVNSRIGLFPSSASHLISGPGFIFAPFPANSSSNYLKLKSKLLIKIIRPFINHKVLPIAYFPRGGKAGARTKAQVSQSIDELAILFGKYRQNKWFDWFYLEAGSGETILPPNSIQKILLEQYETITKKSITSSIPKIVPNTIYGGGISSIENINSILYPKTEIKLIPECIIVGNISESNISVTIDIIKEISNFNNKN